MQEALHGHCFPAAAELSCWGAGGQTAPDRPAARTIGTIASNYLLATPMGTAWRSVALRATTRVASIGTACAGDSAVVVSSERGLLVERQSLLMMVENTSRS